MTGAWLVPMVTAGLFGSGHCIGMCGGLIAVASDGANGVGQRASVQLGYQLARLGSYLTLGIVAGALGRALDFAGQAAGWGKAAAVLAGATMSVWGLAAMLNAVGVSFKLPQLRLLPSFFLTWLGRARQRPPLARAILLGAASALLPCGFLYAFALAGAATGSPVGGALVMAALWLGNLPALVGFGFLLSGVLSRVRPHIPLLSAAMVFGLGVVTLSSRVNLPAFAVAAISHGQSETSGGVRAPMAADCPCHRKHAP
ncbi:MAG TPA: sulfite exporter TauE/SafE family protein [Polyangiaceae bacterium]|nr:sulfite exporter TauE/SafE family protein [Polyangiaceae bacterium]